jgi:hypothetical protein
MIELTAPADTSVQQLSALDAISRAYADGDAPLGELLLAQALDDGLAWDEVCAAAARGVAHRYGGRNRV